MAARPWTEEAVDGFFAARQSPTRVECDRLALSITNRCTVRPVAVPGSLSYTVICSLHQNSDPKHSDTVIVSFRQLESRLDVRIIDLARAIHGCLVPETHYRGLSNRSGPSLAIYTMALLPGVACVEALVCKADLALEEEARYICFMKGLAGYFARCWSIPQCIESHVLAEEQKGISRRLTKLLASPSNVVPTSILLELESALASLYSSEHRQVLTHRDFSKTNVLVNPDTYEITGIVDWSLAAVQPFGFDLDCLFLMTGYMDLSGWHYFSCRQRLLEEFWDEFWMASGITNSGSISREGFRAMALSAAKIGAILRYAFDRNVDGSPAEALSTSHSMEMILRAWFVDNC